MKEHIRAMLGPVMGDRVDGFDVPDRSETDKCVIGNLHRLAKKVEFMCSIDQHDNLATLKCLRRELNAIAREMSDAVKVAEERALRYEISQDFAADDAPEFDVDADYVPSKAALRLGERVRAMTWRTIDGRPCKKDASE